MTYNKSIPVQVQAKVPPRVKKNLENRCNFEAKRLKFMILKNKKSRSSITELFFHRDLWDILKLHVWVNLVQGN